MGQLILIQQPRRVSQMGILGSSKGTSYATGTPGDSGAPPPAPTAVSHNFGLNQATSLLRALDTISNPEAPQRMTATGETLPSSRDKARQLRPPVERPYEPPPQAPPPQGYEPPPGDAPGGGTGGGGAGATGDAGGADADADEPVFLGLTQKQLVIGGALALGAVLLLRKKRGSSSSSSGGGVL